MSVSTRLEYIEVENFKSYKGLKRIGPLKPFNAVIGPNGSGKSNFMDAISFVMGERTQSLRVERLGDLIHGAAIDKPVSKSASVTAVFALDTGETVSFQRSVQRSSSEYRIDGSIVSSNDYLSRLAELKINAKAKNFLVFQGAVESIAMKNPKELSALFEEISGSGALKAEYTRLHQEMQKSNENIYCVFQKKKGINAEKKEATLEQDEAEKYEKLKAKLDEKLVEHQLFVLFHNENETKDLEMKLTSGQKEVDKMEKTKMQLEEKLKAKKKDLGEHNRMLAKIEQDIREAEVEVGKKRPQLIKVKERVSHVQKKVDSAMKTLEQARKAHEDHANDIRKLEEELADTERKKAEYEAHLAEESQSQGRDVHLEDAQVREYLRLKEEAAKRSARHMQELDILNREQKAAQDRMDNFSRMRTTFENQHRQKLLEKEEIERRIERLAKYIRTSEQILKERMQVREDLQSEVVSAREHMQRTRKLLDDVVEQLGDAKTDKREEARSERRRLIVERFKSTYPDVHDRLINLCHPVHKRYNVAITKVLGRNMDAIVVDTVHTAQRCIMYLKEQLLEPETFLPLDNLKTKPASGALRSIAEPQGVKLIYDVLKFDPAIDTAVLFATNDTLVCENTEDARKLAYETDERHNVIALDGTFYRKSGIISGGTFDLSVKARRWDEKNITDLKGRKEILSEELKEGTKQLRKESELNTLESQISGIETRLIYVRTDMENTTQQIEVIKKELSRLDLEITECGPQAEALEQSMGVREQQIRDIKLDMDNVEDAVFSDFCKEIGVRDIRQYEDRELGAHEEKKKKRLAFEEQINRIINTLDFERSRDKQSNIDQWERTVIKEKGNLEACKKQELKRLEDIDKDLQEVERLKGLLSDKNTGTKARENEVAAASRDVGFVEKEVRNAQKSVVSLESKVEGKKNERHNVMMKCKMDGIDIPLAVGSMEDIVATDPSRSSSGDTSSSIQQSERETRIRIDYSTLSDDLQELEKDEIGKIADKLDKYIKQLQKTLTAIKSPNMRAAEKLQLACDKLHATNEEFENLRKQNKKAKAAFEEIKQQRFELFTKCFGHVSNAIDSVYKALGHNPSAQAYMVAVNPEEPYLDGISYNCVVPGKRFLPMSSLSGGEKTVAALALLFAIQSYRPAPFFVLDEVDAALDNTNIWKVAKYLRETAESLQTIVISLKEEFYAHADMLIGISAEVVPADCLESQVATLNLTKYEDLA